MNSHLHLRRLHLPQLIFHFIIINHKIPLIFIFFLAHNIKQIHIYLLNKVSGRIKKKEKLTTTIAVSL